MLPNSLTIRLLLQGCPVSPDYVLLFIHPAFSSPLPRVSWDFSEVSGLWAEAVSTLALPKEPDLKLEGNTESTAREEFTFVIKSYHYTFCSALANPNSLGISPVSYPFLGIKQEVGEDL